MAGTPRHAARRRLPLPLLCLLLQGATAILFAVFVRYNHETDAALWHGGNHSNADNEFYFRYPSECGRGLAGSKDPKEGAPGCPDLPLGVGGQPSRPEMKMPRFIITPFPSICHAPGLC